MIYLTDTGASVHSRTAAGLTALHAAAKADLPDMVRKLLEMGEG